MARGLGKDLYYSVRDSTGAGTVDSADLWGRAAVRTWQSRTNRSKQGGFSMAGAIYGRSSYVKGQGFGTNGSNTAARELAMFGVSPIGNESNEVTVRLLLAAGSQSVSFYAQGLRIDGTPAQAPQLIVSTSSGGWQSASFTMAGVFLRVWSIGDGTTGTGPYVLTVQAASVADGTQLSGITVESAWPKLSLAHMSTEAKPDSVWTLRRIIQQQDYLYQRVPRLLGAHSYEDNGNISNSTPVSHRYVIPRGPSPVGATLYVNAAAAGSAGTINVYVTTVGGAKGSVDGTVSITSASDAWYSISLAAGVWAAGENEVYIDIVGDGSNETTLNSWTMEEVAYTASDYEVSGDTTTTAPVGINWIRPAPGDVIVADYDGGSYANSHKDRLTHADTQLHAGRYGEQMLGQDSLVDLDSPATGRLESQTSWSSPTTMHRLKYTTGAGVIEVEVWAAIYRAGIAEPEKLPRVRAFLGGTEQESVGVDFMGRENETTWVRLGAIPVSSLTTYEIDIKGGWVANSAALPPTTPSSDNLYLQGVYTRDLYSQTNPTTGLVSGGILAEDGDQLTTEAGEPLVEE